MELLSSALKPQKRCWPAWGVACALSLFTPPPWAQDTTMTPGERELKVAFIYNFIRFTDWPEDTGNPLTLCVRGPDPFGTPLDALQGKGVGARTLAIQRRGNEPLKGCQAVFIGSSVFAAWPKTILELQGRPVLTLADTPGAARQGVHLNMAVVQNKVTFEANLVSARAAQLKLNSQLLRLATEVIQ